MTIRDLSHINATELNLKSLKLIPMSNTHKILIKPLDCKLNYEIFIFYFLIFPQMNAERYAYM